MVRSVFKRSNLNFTRNLPFPCPCFDRMWFIDDDCKHLYFYGIHKWVFSASEERTCSVHLLSTRRFAGTLHWKCFPVCRWPVRRLWALISLIHPLPPPSYPWYFSKENWLMPHAHSSPFIFDFTFRKSADIKLFPNPVGRTTKTFPPLIFTSCVTVSLCSSFTPENPSNSSSRKDSCKCFEKA